MTFCLLTFIFSYGGLDLTNMGSKIVENNILNYATMIGIVN